ncbi:MAG: polysaccharide biosynthesis/export family protein [Acidobacteriota bacterium]
MLQSFSIAVLLASLAAAPPGDPPGDPPARLAGHLEVASEEGGYVLGAEDLLDIQVVGVEPLSRTVRVSGAGEITLPLLGMVQVAGLTRSDLERSLAARLEERYLHNPQVSVFVKEYGSKMVSVLGAVKKPGRYPMLGRRTLLDMISDAGGLTEEAGPLAVITHRPEAAGRPAGVLRVDLKALLHGGGREVNPEITQGDLIHVPVDLPVKVYVNGAVKNPGEYETRLSRPLTVLQAITKAGGASDRAALKKVELLRQLPDGSQETLALDLKAIMRGEAEDPVLRDGDVIIIRETYF